ncbi:MAG: bifunctional demethylmenaquinone methyltransferase/2-methoxy-6-polyprenyl-1,4-benzoquinol methylase UbiE [Paludibacteraceae bacterium]|nr:bifunctional demethylmenaquinone methyltransferase/2-methoxy-6-polyprenyl-1,4-benzoquinol methylase UbiE [Paludibacteraceae bacterium]
MAAKTDDKEKGYLCEKVLPYESKGNKKEQITSMFNSISEHYDLMNRAMTMGIDIVWRRKAINSIKSFQPKFILDVATGTGDFAIESYKKLHPEKVIGIDLSKNMLEIGKIKVAKQSLGGKIELTEGDCMNLHYDNSIFDAVTVAFGVRNFESLEKGIKEMNRVLKKGGHLVILEMSEPFTVFKPFYYLYAKFVIPSVGRFYSKDAKAYQYLPQSIDAFPKGKEMTTLLEKCGFSEVKHRRFTFGVCAFYLAKK